MKKLIGFCLLLLSTTLTISCGEEDASEMVLPNNAYTFNEEIHLCFYVEDSQGNELLNPEYEENVLDKGVTLYYNDKVYPLNILEVDESPKRTLDTPAPGWYSIVTTNGDIPDAVWVDGIKVQPIWYGMYTVPDAVGWYLSMTGNWAYQKPILDIGKFYCKKWHDKFYLDFGNGIKQEIEFIFEPDKVKEGEGWGGGLTLLTHNGKDIKDTWTIIVE